MFEKILVREQQIQYKREHVWVAFLMGCCIGALLLLLGGMIGQVIPHP